MRERIMIFKLKDLMMAIISKPNEDGPSSNSQGPTKDPRGNIPERKVRDCQPISLKPEVKSLVIGSSLVKRIVNDNSIPTDIGIHAYPGSTTEEKHSVLTKYTEKQLKTVVIQDGTNSILKFKRNQ